MTAEELRQSHERMQETGISSLTAYMIRMAIHGYVIKMDLADLKELLRLMQISGNNLNQYAKKANETGSIYHEDNGWVTTDKGEKFSMWHKGVLNSDAWHPELVDEIIKYLKSR